MLKQISAARQEKMLPLLAQHGLDLDTPYPIRKLQPIAFNSFKTNYPAEMLASIIQEYPWL